ncbi:SGNH/GDSL hydrolase family protein [Streptomyces drozdowiczii]|uniref:SGNH/GDSL hydrolase family protein n=1 Tax=Streptomyces drozdowiczii TaxID=202862 RepID=A0ABY6Q144_9ACTN|nr:SGNH/GDSL hydrolase family protein [Streptomyces drozdowiczii]MCX0241790.1 SGNH/GDSL hydrolase family protein [Streptomyces drozdowiczii]UZK58000.1 SGNH/GDSL hydrolase family protein [Streptomyces drozdowiczii]
MTTRVACLGDSLTRAQFSVDYLGPLERCHAPGDVRLARFGVNGDFAYNLLQRLDAVVADPPDVITVLVGTNDARASLAGYAVEQAMKRKKLPERPSASWFQQCLGDVVARLRAETDAAIGLLSLPVLGQRLDGAAAHASLAYSRMIAEVAATGGVAYLPLHERQTEELREADPPPVPYREVTPAAGLGVLLQHAVLRRSLDTISRRRGLVLTTDHIHQNSRGAGLIAEVIDAGLLARSV